jgi:autotransporter-associated beta strand protein
VTVSALASSATINSLRFTAGGASNIGVGKTLILGSGGLIFTNNNGAIGTSGLPTSGTLQFGEDVAPAEGVVWANGTNTNTIAASIAGDLGLSKAGTGTLILTGSNSYSGDTYVGGGTLQVGTGLFSSNLGSDGDVTVATGAVLSLLNGGAIPDDATLTLEQFGLFNGKVNLSAGVNESVGSLIFGDDFQLPGTWGSTASTALFKNDTYFSGTGLLTVVPEPRSAMMLLLATAALLGRRRRAGGP